MNCPNKVVKLGNNGPEIWDYTNENRQKFNIKYDSFKRYYSIQCIADDCPKYLTCDIKNIYPNDKTHGKNQQWHIVITEDNNYDIICEANSYYMNVEEGNNNGTKIKCNNKTGKSNQRFNFESTTKTPPPPPPRPPEPPRPPQPPVRYFPRPNFHGIYNDRNSIVDALRSVGFPSDKSYRRIIGDINHVPGVPFSPEYNTYLLNLMKEGRLIMP